MDGHPCVLAGCEGQTARAQALVVSHTEEV